MVSHPEAARPDRARAARFPLCRAGHVGFPNVQLALGFPGGGTRPCPWLRVEGVGSTRGPTLLASSDQHWLECRGGELSPCHLCWLCPHSPLLLAQWLKVKAVHSGFGLLLGTSWRTVEVLPPPVLSHWWLGLERG